MKIINLYKLISLLAICTILLSVSFGQEKQSEKSLQKSLKRKLRIEEVKSYRQMNRLNTDPIAMDKATSNLCGREWASAFDPHYAPGIVYYINDIAQKGLIAFKEKSEFPIGSVIVKEKQEKQTEDSVKIITVMKKIKVGNEEDSWDYKLYDVVNWRELKQFSFRYRSKVVTPITRSNKCIDCHKLFRGNDFISPKGMVVFFPKK
jgi:hypothetical protein